MVSVCCPPIGVDAVYYVHLSIVHIQKGSVEHYLSHPPEHQRLAVCQRPKAIWQSSAPDLAQPVAGHSSCTLASRIQMHGALARQDTYVRSLPLPPPSIRVSFRPEVVRLGTVAGVSAHRPHVGANHRRPLVQGTRVDRAPIVPTTVLGDVVIQAVDASPPVDEGGHGHGVALDALDVDAWPVGGVFEQEDGLVGLEMS